MSAQPDNTVEEMKAYRHHGCVADVACLIKRKERLGAAEAVLDMEKIAVVPGTFDPVTAGHLALITRAASLFDHVCVAVCDNTEKRTMFTPEQRLELVSLACADLHNIEVRRCSGLLADFLDEVGASVLVKGVRGAVDFDYESSMASITRSLAPAVDTVLLPAYAEVSYISSTYVRELIRYGRPLVPAVPPKAAEQILRWRDMT